MCVYIFHSLYHYMFVCICETAYVRTIKSVGEPWERQKERSLWYQYSAVLRLHFHRDYNKLRRRKKKAKPTRINRSSMRTLVGPPTVVPCNTQRMKKKRESLETKIHLQWVYIRRNWRVRDIFFFLILTRLIKINSSRLRFKLKGWGLCNKMFW